MKKLGQWFIQGLLVLFPVVVTVAIVVWLATSAEATLGYVIRYLMPDSWYLPGMGIISAVVLIALVGLLVNLYLFRQLVKLVETLFSKIPLVEVIYTSVRDIARFASASQSDDELKSAVMVSINEDTQLMGFITDESASFSEHGDKELCAVYLPMSYQIGGYTLFLPKSQLTPLDMSVQDAMRYLVTAGMTNQNKEPGTKQAS